MLLLASSYLLALSAWIFVIGTLVASRYAADLSAKRRLWRRCFIATLILVPLPCFAYGLVCIDDWRNGASLKLSDAAFLIVGLFGPAPLAYFAWHLARSQAQIAS